jgi:hypothetical protein
VRCFCEWLLDQLVGGIAPLFDRRERDGSRAVATRFATVLPTIDSNVLRAYGWRRLTVWRVCHASDLIVECGAITDPCMGRIELVEIAPESSQ